LIGEGRKTEKSEAKKKAKQENTAVKKGGYVLNTKTKKLHILGCCHHVSDKSLDFGHQYFATEKEARAVCDLSVCEICQRKRDEILKTVFNDPEFEKKYFK